MIGQSAFVRRRGQWLGLVALTTISVGCASDEQRTSTASAAIAPISTATAEAVAASVADTHKIEGRFALVGGLYPGVLIPAAGTIKVIAADTGVIVAEVTTATDGAFALSVPSGTYSLVGTTPQYQNWDTPCVLDDVSVPGPRTGDLLVGCQMK